MYYSSTRVLALLAIQVGLVYSFSWDIVVGAEKRLEFYYNGTLSHTEHIRSADYIRAVTYDPVHYRILFADNNNVNHSVSSFDLSTRTIQLLVTSERDDIIYSLAYDPVTQLLFWQEGAYNIYWFSLEPASSYKMVDGNYFGKSNHACWAIAVDSCGGYIYWVTNFEIERARFDGSDREVLIESEVYYRRSLAIDQQTQKMYWIEIILKQYGNQVSIESADLQGKNKTTYIVKNEKLATSLTVSKDFIYWRGADQNGINQLQKHAPQNVEAKLYSISHSNFCWKCQRIAANYTIKEQTENNQKCKTLKSLIPNFSEPHSSDVREKPSGESRCECTQGYTGEICAVNICQNYCFQGDCSVSAEGQPKCSCKAGYYGERCEVNACHRYCLNDGVCSLNDQHSPVCKCIGDYEGARCEVSNCKDYCLQGNCSVSTEGQPKCRCYSNAVSNACHQYCLNDGTCSLNEENVPVCQCTADYEGERCDVPAFLIKFFVYAYKSLPPVALSKGVESKCASTVD